MRSCAITPEPMARRTLQNLCQFRRKSATGRLFTIPGAAAFPAVRTLLLWGLLLLLGLLLRPIGTGSRGGGWLLLSSRRLFALRRLSRVGPQQAVFERRAIETADDGGHFIGCGRFYEGETLRLLCFVIADHLYGIGHKIFGGQPLLNIVGGDPRREVAKKNGKAQVIF